MELRASRVKAEADYTMLDLVKSTAIWGVQSFWSAVSRIAS